MKKILIVEDDQMVANIYRNKFSVEGFSVEIAGDGGAGLETLRAFQPDAMILDLILPKMSGVDMMKKVRADPQFEKLPIIVFSNTYMTNLIQDAWKAGATKCLSKSCCSPKQLVEIVKSTLGSDWSGTNGAKPGDAAAPDPAPPVSTALASEEARFEAALRRAFLAQLPDSLATLRTLLQGIIKGEDETVQLKNVHEMYRRVHALTSNASAAGMLEVAQLTDAIEALLRELYAKPKNLNASTMRTLASGIDSLGPLFQHAAKNPGQSPASANILVVDDEAISRRAVTFALEKARLKSVSLEDPQLAYNLLAENKFDLIFLDVDMPGMNGFELCEKLRALPGHKKTPVVFVTGLHDFESRAKSLKSGGNDLIAKPFLFIELAVKALVYVLRNRETR